MKPVGYWKGWKHVNEALDTLANKLQHFPTQKEMIQHGYPTLPSAIVNYHGGTNAVRKRKQVAIERHDNGYWTLENTLHEAEKIVRKEGRIPSQKRLRELHLSSLSSAIINHGGMQRICKLLHVEPRERPKKYWNDETAKKEYRQFSRKLGHPATNNELLENDLAGMADYINKKMGGVRAVRQRLNFREGRKQNRYWTLENTVVEARKLVEKEGDLPSSEALRKRGDGALASAISKHGGYPYMRRKHLGLEDSNTKPDGYWNNKKNILTEVRKVAEELGHIPTFKELIDRKMSSLGSAIARHIGFTNLRIMFKEEILRVEPGYWSDQQILKECKKVVKEYGDLPSARRMKDLDELGRLKAQIQHKGGFARFRKLLGLPENCKPSNYWSSKKNVLREIKAMLAKEGLQELPSQQTMTNGGYASLTRGIAITGGYRYWREKLGERQRKTEDGKWMDLQSALEEAGRIMKKHRLHELPSRDGFITLGCGGFYDALVRHHGGIIKFRGLLAQHLGTPTHKDQLEDLLRGYTEQ